MYITGPCKFIFTRAITTLARTSYQTGFWLNLNYNPCKIKFSSSSSLSLVLPLSLSVSLSFSVCFCLSVPPPPPPLFLLAGGVGWKGGINNCLNRSTLIFQCRESEKKTKPRGEKRKKKEWRFCKFSGNLSLNAADRQSVEGAGWGGWGGGQDGRVADGRCGQSAGKREWGGRRDWGGVSLVAGATTSIIFVTTKRLLSRQKYPCNDKTFVATKLCLSWQNSFLATKHCVSRQNFCRDIRRVLPRQTRVCRDKNYTCGNSRQW